MDNAEQIRVFLWVVLALGLGSLVGLEREYRGHEAGIRTTALVCAGSALFAEVSREVGDTRIAAGVVQGIGFLGAGLVFQRGESVKGVTTAATIWVIAAVGLLVGSHLWLAALLASLMFVVLLELAPVSDWVLSHGKPHDAANEVAIRRRRRREVTPPDAHDDAPRPFE